VRESLWRLGIDFEGCYLAFACIAGVEVERIDLGEHLSSRCHLLQSMLLLSPRIYCRVQALSKTVSCIRTLRWIAIPNYSSLDGFIEVCRRGALRGTSFFFDRCCVGCYGLFCGRPRIVRTSVQSRRKFSLLGLLESQCLVYQNASLIARNVIRRVRTSALTVIDQYQVTPVH
jgi:hypothetical protein